MKTNLFRPFVFSLAALLGGEVLARPNYAAGEILVKFKERVSSSRQSLAMSKRGHSSLRSLGGASRRTSRVKLDSTDSVEDALASYRNDPDVEYAEPNYILKLTALPNDPRFSAQWGLRNTGQTVSASGIQGTIENPATGTSGSDMDLESAWNLVTDCSSVNVAVIDSGVQYAHEDLAASMWTDVGFPNHGYDTVGSNSMDPIDLNGHGTHVASIIGAVGGNGIGGTGVCQKASLMAVRAADASGSLTVSDVVEAIDWSIAHGAKVMNMSFATGSKSTSLEDAIRDASTAGVVVIVAAGNEGVDNDLEAASYPCNYTLPNLVCVGALNPEYKLADFSNYGGTSVDVAAPGANITSGWNGEVQNFTFSVGSWTLGTGWNMRNLATTDGSTVAVLSNPTNWLTTPSATYANNLDSSAWKNFNFSALSAASDLRLSMVVEVQLGSGDTMSVVRSTTAGNSDPIPSGTSMIDFDSSDGDFADVLSASMTSFRNSNLTIGFRLQSNSSGSGKGAGIYDFSLERLTLSTSAYRVEHGTSMAAPHVTGVAAMLLAYNPGYTMSDVVEALKNGGEKIGALSGKTTTGRAANAMGSLAYIRAPQGVSAAVSE
jgi:subtilisin family serine protease